MTHQPAAPLVPPGPVGTVDRREHVPFVLGPVAARTWKEFGYLNLALLIAPFAFTYTIFTISFTAGILVTVVGLLLSGWLVLGGRAWGAMFRGLASGLLATDVPAPVPHRARGGFWRRTGTALADGAGWRALAFGVLVLPLSVVAFTLSWVVLGLALGGMTHWFWSRWLPEQQADDGSWHRGASINSDWFFDTPGRQQLLVLIGIGFAFLWPWITIAMAHLFRMLTVALLGPTRSSQRVQHLEEARGHAVLDSDARLRRIERDLHDGTQARLVAVAMQLGDARERLRDDELDRDEALGMLDDAHGAMKEALVELREIARGIHPPALDDGLAVALETLAARCAVPVTVDVDLPVAPAPEVATIAYFCVAELLTNVARHSGASGAYVRADEADGCLRLRVRDDGRGGAAVAVPGASGGTGLGGLTERARTIDGALEIDSPAGGPTVVTVHLPLSVVA